MHNSVTIQQNERRSVFHSPRCEPLEKEIVIADTNLAKRMEFFVMQICWFCDLAREDEEDPGIGNASKSESKSGAGKLYLIMFT